MKKNDMVTRLIRAKANAHIESFPQFEEWFYNSKGDQVLSLETALAEVLVDLQFYRDELYKELKHAFDGDEELTEILDEFERAAKFIDKYQYLEKYVKNETEMRKIFDRVGL